MRRLAEHPMAAWLLAAIALGLAAAGVRPYAGSWNDGSRLAAVESLLDRGTLAIDDSVFCHTPQRLLDDGHLPYSADRYDLHLKGTQDKVFVRGHFHSEKPALVSVLMAGLYKPLMWLGFPSPGERPDVFAWVMTVLTSGLGYAAAVGCLWALGTRLGLSPGWRLAWITSFALSTFALTYTRHVNSHAMQLGVVAGLCLMLVRRAKGEQTSCGSLLLVGTLAGLGFNLDFGTGPPLVAFVGGAVWWRTRASRPVLIYTLAVLPWAVAAVGLNYTIGGVWLPINMYPEHFNFPGSPFSEENLTGVSRHGLGSQILYAGDLLVGKKGYLNHNLPLLLGSLAGWRVMRREFPGRVELLMLLGWCVSAWLVYAVLSNNLGGGCCSVRWFMPFLAPGFWLLAVLLRDQPSSRPHFIALSAWGGVLAGIMWWSGPWTLHVVPMMWLVVGCALFEWGVAAWREGSPSLETLRPATIPVEGNPA